MRAQVENRDEIETPRGMRTPITEAATALNVAIEFYAEFAEMLVSFAPAEDQKKLRPDDAEGDYFGKQFIEDVFGEAWRDDATDGDEKAAMIGLTPDGKQRTGDEDVPFILLSIAETIAAYAVQAMKAAKDEQGASRGLAWTYAISANYWAGILTAAWSRSDPDAQHKGPAAALARLRHAETYAMREEALKYWRENIDPGLSAAKAANTLMTVVPLSHKKLAEIVSAEKKKATPDGVL